VISAIIPSYKDPALFPTIDSLLNNAVGEIEVIVVLDGYEPKREFRPEVRVIRHERNLGMREAINTGVRAARFPYILRSDEHCMFGPAFDALLLEEMCDNWIVKPRRFKLDPIAWKVTPDRPIDYEKLIIKTDNHRKFSAVEWKARSRERAHILLDEDMAMQGSVWLMARSWWESVIKELQTEGYGPHYQDSTEMLFKTWRAGGKLMLNKKTWHAHKHRDFPRTHNYGGPKAQAEWDYALQTWMPDYLEIKKRFGL